MIRTPKLVAPWTAVCAAILLAGCSSAGELRSVDSGSQLEFGIKMARRGLWNEALFRFEQARRLDPQNPKVLNDLAVAYEANGRFDDAKAAYEEALAVAPGAADVKRNYTRFLEFYQGYRPGGGQGAPAAQPTSPPTPAGGAR